MENNLANIKQQDLQNYGMRERAETVFLGKAARARMEAAGFEKLAQFAKNCDADTEEFLWRVACGYTSIAKI